MEYLDMRTTFVVVSMLGLVLLVCMIYVSQTRKTYPGFHYWTASAVLYFMGNSLLGLRGILPDFFSIVLANALVTATFWIIPYGLALFVQRRHPVWPYLLPVLVVAAWVSYFTYVSPDIRLRIMFLSVMFTVATLYSIVLFKRYVPPFLNGSSLLLTVTFSGGALWSTGRLLYTYFFEWDLTSFLSSSLMQSASIVIYCGLFTFVCFGLCVLNFQRLEHDLLEAKDEVKVLKGILPICSSCKKIRDDQGYWSQVESYIREHSDATFSHSICPDCLKKLYPGAQRTGGAG